MKILVTGAAGFIGMHVALSLLRRGDTVVGVDNINDYYSQELKLARIRQLEPHENFSFQRIDVADRTAIANIFRIEGFDRVVHLAAQAGVRYSLFNPHAYVDSNILGFVNILESCRLNSVGHLVYASSSSVYGGNSKVPFSESDPVDHPVSLYAATKKANELMAHTYSHLYGLPTTGLRFFTVYGPWGRPDMAYFSFTESIVKGVPIKIFNHGKMRRDFTYIDDIVDGLVAVLDKPATPDSDFNSAEPSPGTASVPFRIFNIGNNNPVELEEFVRTLEVAIGKSACREYLPMQPGDVEVTYADVRALADWTGFEPRVNMSDGIQKFVEWYRGWSKE